jgi:hypothetical protein
MLAKRDYILLVSCVEDVPGRVVDHHDVAREAGDFAPSYAGDATESMGGVDPVLAVGHPVGAVAFWREPERVDVDLMPIASPNVKTR